MPSCSARVDAEPRLNPREVADAQWVDPADLAVSLRATPWAFSPWLVLQAEQLGIFDTPAPPAARCAWPPRGRRRRRPGARSAARAGTTPP
jgi:isopentenyl-diphosphate delta-isomerase